MQRIFLAVLFIFLIGCSKKDGYTIEGSIAGLEGTVPIYMHKMEKGNLVPLDTAMAEEGEFGFSGTLTYPELLYLQLGKTQKMINFFCDNKDITITGQVDQLTETIVIGSEINDQFMDFTKLLKPYGDVYNGLVENYRTAVEKGDEVLVQRLTEEIEAVDQKQDVAIYRFLAGDADPHLQLFIIVNYLSYKVDGPTLEKLLNNIDPSARLTESYIKLAQKLEVLQKVAIGQLVQHFALNDTTGNVIPLSTFNDKILLIDFWASWCGPCRRENPNVVAVYEEFKDQGFEILGVSLDQDRASWVQAIKDDRLSWSHVSDLKGWQSAAGQLYGISSIPQTILIDSEGIIIARNLKTDQLREKLRELLEVKNS